MRVLQGLAWSIVCGRRLLLLLRLLVVARGSARLRWVCERLWLAVTNSWLPVCRRRAEALLILRLRTVWRVCCLLLRRVRCLLLRRIHLLALGWLWLDRRGLLILLLLGRRGW